MASLRCSSNWSDTLAAGCKRNPKSSKSIDQARNTTDDAKDQNYTIGISNNDDPYHRTCDSLYGQTSIQETYACGSVSVRCVPDPNLTNKCAPGHGTFDAADADTRSRRRHERFDGK